MRYWWVNQNQTYRQEVEGGYLWSPKRKANGGWNPFYEFMREVAPGDLVFSFANQRIPAIGLARSYAYEAPKPVEFGAAGRNWEEIGWRVDVHFTRIETTFRPVDWIERLRPLLPDHYSPLLPDGRGVQSIYLTRLPEPLALALADLIGTDIGALARSEAIRDRAILMPRDEVLLWEEHLRRTIELDENIESTQKSALILARRGQGLFRERVQQVESRCRITLVDRPEHLRASHCKPWRDCSNDERLDADNGLMLTPSIDHLFDRGFISFEGSGDLLVSPVAHRESLARMGVAVDRRINVGAFRPRQMEFLEYHRDAVYLKARLRA
jgi:hypothetical protein